MVAAEQRALKNGVSRKDAIDAVRDYFYRGEVAQKIDAFSKANGGLLRYEDMAAFRIKPEEPASVTYHDYTGLQTRLLESGTGVSPGAQHARA